MVLGILSNLKPLISSDENHKIKETTKDVALKLCMHHCASYFNVAATESLAESILKENDYKGIQYLVLRRVRRREDEVAGHGVLASQEAERR